MKEKNDFEITLLDSDQKTKTRAGGGIPDPDPGGGNCTCSPHSTMVDDTVDELCEGEIMVN